MLKMFLIAANPVTSWFNNQIHRFLLWLDQSVYWFAAQCYQLFMKLSTAQIFTDDFFSSFAKRIYAILGVFMLFYLVYALLNAIVDPDKLTNDKGAGKIAVNLIISLTLLGLLPNIFDLAYRMQNFVLSSNLLGAVILGSDVVDVSDSESVKENNESLIRFGDYASFTVLNSFLNPENVNPTLDNSYNWYGVKEEILEDGNWKNLTLLSDAVSNGTSIDGENVVVTYRPLVSTAAGIFLIYILLSFTLDLGVRVVKFAFYELLAPIPIVLRIIPSKKGTFDKWLKQTLSVYFEVFVRVGLMYIAIYFINAITKNNTLMEMWTESTSGKLALAIIIMGVFAFAKQAPKIISDVLGIETGGLKLGIGDKLKAGGFFGAGALAGFGAVSGALSGALGGAWAAKWNGVGIGAGLAYGAANGWKNKGNQFNAQRKSLYTGVLGGKGTPGIFGGQARLDKWADSTKKGVKDSRYKKASNYVANYKKSDNYNEKFQTIQAANDLKYNTALGEYNAKHPENVEKLNALNEEKNKYISDYRNNEMKKLSQRMIDEKQAFDNSVATKRAEIYKNPNLTAKQVEEELGKLNNLKFSYSSELQKQIDDINNQKINTLDFDRQISEIEKADQELNEKLSKAYNDALKDNVDKNVIKEIGGKLADAQKYVNKHDDDKRIEEYKNDIKGKEQIASLQEALKNFSGQKFDANSGVDKPNDKK